MILRTPALAGILIAAMTLTACGSDGDSDTDASSDETSSSASSSSSSSSGSEYGAALTYVGGTDGAADDSLDPVTIGWVNSQGGMFDLPEATSGFEAAVQLVNEHLGGVDGRPIEVVSCYVGDSEEDGQKCAQQMYNDDSVEVVLTGAAGAAAGSLHSLLGDSKALLGGVPGTAEDTEAKNAFYTAGGPLAQAALVSYVTEELDAKSISFIASEGEYNTSALNQIKEAAADAGVTVTAGLYPPGSADVSSAVLASDAREADVVIVEETSEPGCVAIAQALQQYNVTAPVISLAGCIGDSVKESMGDYLKWTYAVYNNLPAEKVDPPNEETSIYMDAMATYQPDSTLNGTAPTTFANAMFLVRLLNEIGADNITASSISEALAASTGPVYMGTPTLEFGVEGRPALGSIAWLFYEYVGDDTFQVAGDGKWFS